MRISSGLLLALLAVACSGRQDTGPALVDVTADCPWNLELRVAEDEVRTYSTDTGDIIDERVEAVAESGLIVHSELFTEGGVEAVEYAYLCADRSLSMHSLRSDVADMEFEPPLAVLPAELGASVVDGTVSWGDQTELAFRYAYEAAASDRPDWIEAEVDGTAYRIVRSVLLITDGEGDEYQWMTETWWKITDLEVIPIRRDQVYEDPYTERHTVETLVELY